MITKECEYCGEKFDSFASDNRMYCSKKCSYKGISKRAEDERKCEFCNDVFKCKKGDTQRFCSMDCVRKWKSKKSTVEKHCLNCGKEFKTAKSDNHKFCNHSCFREYEIKNRKSKIRDCQYCGKEFLAKPIKHNSDGYAKYCSERCYHKDLKEKHWINRTCKNCGTKFNIIKGAIDSGTGTFCSKECQNEFQRTGEYRNCEECGKQFYVSLCKMNDNFKHQYCSKKCHGKARNIYPNTYSLRCKINNRRNGARYYMANKINLDKDKIPDDLVGLKVAELKLKQQLKLKEAKNE
jgi:hypothetical protein